MDGDRDCDFVAGMDVYTGVDPLNGGREAKILVYMNTDGHANFSAHQAISAERYNTYVTCADIDNDSDQDIVWAAKDPGQIVWYENLSIQSQPGDANGTSVSTSWTS